MLRIAIGITSAATIAFGIFMLALPAHASDSPIDRRQIIRQVVPKDAIPALVLPKYVAIKDADFMRPDDKIIAMSVNGEDRAYPTRILDHHEIVNDLVAGQPVVITYCPLCGSATGFVPIVNGKLLVFGVSGNLYNSNLLMYDRQTNTLWLQESGQAVEGDLTGAKLTFYPVSYDDWAHWKAQHPDGQVLSIHNGFERRFGNYEISPYKGYESTGDLWFPVNHDDKRLPRKARVIGVEVRGGFKAYPEDVVWKRGAIEDRIGGLDVVLLADRESRSVGIFARGDHQFTLADGKVKDEHGAAWRWPGDRLLKGGDALNTFAIVPTFWFAWAAMHPNTDLYK